MGVSSVTPAAVTLTVSDLSRSIAYYSNAIGLRVNSSSDDGSARLGVTGRDLVVLVEQPGARPGRGRTTGLFHLALLLPTRRDLGTWLAHAAADGVHLTGASDHFVSEALYLRDPDGHGIEIYADRPRSSWTRLEDGSLNIGTVALDLHDVMSDHGAWEGSLPDGTVMGHIHLQVAHLAEARQFYIDALGLDLMIEIPGQASFLSTAGYHHHLGLNVWAGVGAPPPPADQAALRAATWTVDSADELDAIEARLADGGFEPVRSDGRLLVADPSRNPLELRIRCATDEFA
jgi:catechol 2,3-dioxygenase